MDGGRICPWMDGISQGAMEGGACMSSCKEVVGRLLLVEKPKTKFPEFSPSFKGFDQRQKTNDQRPFLVKEY